MVWGKLVSVFDYFSIDLLVRTWFAPFRQISAGAVDGPIGVQIRAFFDRLISRTIGGIVRGLSLLLLGRLCPCCHCWGQGLR